MSNASMFALREDLALRAEAKALRWKEELHSADLRAGRHENPQFPLRFVSGDLRVWSVKGRWFVAELIGEGVAETIHLAHHRDYLSLRDLLDAEVAAPIHVPAVA